ncbi:uncharacterized protein [Paralichthys olivaceus]|uniref:uncharacterized protein n=1 Tax=Paralichthys olivaceus TaxID=8255 RepID=UPI0037524F8F
MPSNENTRDSSAASVALTAYEVKAGDVLQSSCSSYSVLNLIGEGTFGKIAASIDLRTKQNVAVKILKKRESTQDTKHEVSMLKLIGRLDSTYMVRFHEQFVHMEQNCLVFERLDISLYDLQWRQRKYLPLNQIRPIAKQVFEALDALKGMDVIHADIKPENIMFVHLQNQPLRVKLIDFGCSMMKSKIHQGMYIQPNGYRAPEISLGLPFTEAVDVWGVGCVLAFLYMAQNPFCISSDYQMMKGIVTVLGQPEDRLLRDGNYSRCFFIEEWGADRSSWRLMTAEEFRATNCLETEGVPSSLSSLISLIFFHPWLEAAEMDDRMVFVNLLSGLLHVDGDQRITPRQALRHPFITMSHLRKDGDSWDYRTSSQLAMKVCPNANSVYCATSDSSHGATSDSSHGAISEKGYTESMDKVSCEALVFTSAPKSSTGDKYTSSEDDGAFYDVPLEDVAVDVTAAATTSSGGKRKWLRRIQKFFSSPISFFRRKVDKVSCEALVSTSAPKSSTGDKYTSSEVLDSDLSTSKDTSVPSIKDDDTSELSWCSDATVDDVAVDDAAVDEAAVDDAAVDDAAVDDVAVDDVAVDDAAVDDAAVDDVAVDDVALDDAAVDMAVDDAAVDDAAVDVALDDVALDDVAFDDVAVDDVAVDDVAFDDVAFDDVALDNGAFYDVALDDGAFYDVHLDDVAVDDAAVDEAAVDDVAVDNVAVDVAVDDAAVDDAAVDVAVDMAVDMAVDVAVDDVAFDDVAFDDVAFDDVALDDGAFYDVALDDWAFYDVPLDDVAVDVTAAATASSGGKRKWLRRIQKFFSSPISFFRRKVDKVSCEALVSTSAPKSSTGDKYTSSEVLDSDLSTSKDTSLPSIKDDDTSELSWCSEATVDDVAVDDAAVDEAAVDDVAVDNVAVDDAAVDDVAVDVAVDDAAVDDVAVDDAAVDDVAVDVAVDDAAVDDAAVDDAAVDDAAVDDVAVDVAVDDAAVDDVAVDDAAVDDVAVDVAVDDAAVDDAAVDDAAVDDAAVDDVAVDDAAVDDVAVDDAAVDDAAVDDAAVDDAAVDDAAVDDAAVDDAAVDDAAVDVAVDVAFDDVALDDGAFYDVPLDDVAVDVTAAATASSGGKRKWLRRIQKFFSSLISFFRRKVED